MHAKKGLAVFVCNDGSDIYRNRRYKHVAPKELFWNTKKPKCLNPSAFDN